MENYTSSVDITVTSGIKTQTTVDDSRVEVCDVKGDYCVGAGVYTVLDPCAINA